jgi:putative flippase GtrA
VIRRVIRNKLVRYFMSAGIATFVDIFVYFLAYNYLFQKQDIQFTSQLVVSAPTISLVISFTCGLITNFIITKYLVFTDSDLRGIHQLARYVLVAVFVLLLNYLMMSFLIKVLGWYPTFSRVASAITIGMLSFVIHKAFSFRVSAKDSQI